MGDVEIKSYMRYQCIYYDPLAQEDMVIEIVAKGLKEAYLIAYLATKKRFNFDDLNIQYKSERLYSLDNCREIPDKDDMEKLNKFWDEYYGDDDDELNGLFSDEFINQIIKDDDGEIDMPLLDELIKGDQDDKTRTGGTV